MDGGRLLWTRRHQFWCICFITYTLQIGGKEEPRRTGARKRGESHVGKIRQYFNDGHHDVLARGDLIEPQCGRPTDAILEEFVTQIFLTLIAHPLENSMQLLVIIPDDSCLH
ncbi:hypothetical protein BKA93DRAFT_752152 [Sparassis latifolia]